jgi:hypothetical protein
MHGLMRNYSRFTAVFISALLFALFHLNPWQFPATFILGLFLGILMIRTRNIYICIIGHAINNGLVLLSIQFWDELQKSAYIQSSKPTQLIGSALIATVALALVFLLTRKRQAKEN